MMRRTRFRYAVPLLAGLAVLLAAAGLFAATRVSPASNVGGPFTLVRASDGAVVTDRDFLGRNMLVYFGYTTCPDICPTTLADVAAALHQLGPLAQKIQPVFITIDPARDTPAVLKPYLAQFSPLLEGLTGTAQQIAAAETAYKVYAAKTPTGLGPNDYTIDHSSFFYLMGPDGRFMALLPADGDGKALAAELKQYVE